MPIKIILLRHAETEKDQMRPAKDWGLTTTGVEQAKSLIQDKKFLAVDFIYTSTEAKSIATASFLANFLNLSSTPLPNFDEVQRSNRYYNELEFEAEKSRQLLNLDYKAFAGESGSEALLRFKEGIEKVSEGKEGKTILIVTHGTILNIYFAKLLAKESDLPERWSKTAFCSYGIVENGEVVRDII